MGKFQKLMLMYEAKEIVKIVFAKGSYQIIGDDGISPTMTRSQIVRLMNSTDLESLDTKSDATEDILKEVETARDNQVDIKIDSKDVKKLNLR